MPDMTNYETKHSTYDSNEQRHNTAVQRHNSTLQQYNIVKRNLIDAINNDIETIFLIGSGGNGKTHLSNELNNMLNTKNYTTHQHGRFYSRFDDDASVFNEEINRLIGKNLIHLLFNPFTRWNISLPLNSQIISMEHINYRNYIR